jgi:AcrR family transcriptional regulator
MPNPVTENHHLTGISPIEPKCSQAKYTGKRLEILKAALETISIRGLKDATITEIAKKAGVVDSIIYHYFKNKEDLIYSVYDLLQHTALDQLSFHFEGIMGPVSKLGKMIWYHLYMNDTDRNTQVRKSILLEARARRSFLKHESFNTLLKYMGVLDHILEEGIKEGHFRSDVNIAVVRTMIFGLLDEEALICLGSNDRTDTLSDFDQIMTLVLAMIENRSPRKETEAKPDKYFAILEAAKTLFGRKGYDSTTMMEVAMNAGVAEGTIYEYFKNKEDLLLSITKEYFGLYKTRLDDAFTFPTALSRLRHVMWSHFSIFAADRDLVTVFLKDTKLSNHFYTSNAHAVFVDYHDKIIEMLDEGKQSGEFRPDISSRIFRNLVMGSLANLYNRWYYRAPMTPLEYTVEMHQFIDLLCRAVAIPKHTA